TAVALQPGAQLKCRPATGNCRRAGIDNPGRRSTILYCPPESVTTLRDFSMSAGLAASTVTPGRTAPVESLTVPEMALWPLAVAQIASRHKAGTPVRRIRRRMTPPFTAIASWFVAHDGVP